MDIRPHRKLEVWRQSLVLVKTIYQITESFPKAEQFGLTSQIRRAAVSIPSNLAEGAGRSGKKEFGYFLNVAQGSSSELDTQVELAKMLGYVNEDVYSDMMNQLTTISKMLYGLARKVRSEM